MSLNSSLTTFLIHLQNKCNSLWEDRNKMGIKRDFSNSACYQLTTEHGSPYPYFSDSKKKSYSLCFHCPSSHFRVHTTSSCHFQLASLCLVSTTHPSFLLLPRFIHALFLNMEPHHQYNTLWKPDYFLPDELWSHQNPEHLKNGSQEVEVQDRFLNCREWVLELMTEIVPRSTIWVGKKR